MIGTSFQEEVLKRLSDLGPVYIVGGAVRDAELGILSKDVDVVIAYPLSEIELKLSDWGYSPHLIGAKQQTVSLFRETERFDINTFSGELEVDAGRRDFTMNAIYQDVRTGEIKDPLGGLCDLKKGRLKACVCAGERFKEDPLRILRLIRFAVRYNFEIEPETWRAAIDLIPLIGGVTSERVTEELAKILVLEEVDKALGLLDELGYFQTYIPELARLKGLVQNCYHTKDAWEHTRHVVKNTPAQVLLRLAALFHDLGKWETASRECYVWGVMRLTAKSYEVNGFKLIGKNLELWTDKNVEVHGGRLDNYPDTIVVKRLKAATPTQKKSFKSVPEGKRHFLQHERESARLVRKILTRFQWSVVLPGGRKGERELEYLVSHHMVGTLTFMSELKGDLEHLKLLNKTRRFAWEIGWNGQIFDRQRVENLLNLWRADFLGGKQVSDETIEGFGKLQGQIEEACVFLKERIDQLDWVYFEEFAHGKGLKGEAFGRFKEQIRRQVIIDIKYSPTDPQFLDREYGYFWKTENKRFGINKGN